MSLKQKALSGTFWTSIQTFATQGIVFGVSIVLARLLLPEEFGLISILGVFMSLGTSFINSGLTQSLIRTEDPDEEDFSTVFYFNLAISVLIYALLFFTAPLIADFYNQQALVDIVRIYSTTFIINAFSVVQSTRLTKMMDFKTQMIVSVPSLIISSIVGVGMALLGFGVWSLVASSVVKSLAGTIQLWYRTKWVPIRVFNKIKFKLHFYYGMKLLISNMLDVLFTNIYTLIIGKFFAISQVAFYNRADALQMLPVGNLNAIVKNVTFPLFASIQNDNERLKSVYKKIMQMVIFLVAPTLILMSVLAEPLFRFLFTEKWLPAVPYFQILCLNGILYPIHSYNLQILNVKGRSDLFLKLEVIKKVLVIVILLLSFPFGVYGLLYGSVITSIICFFINTHYSGKFLNYTAWEQIKDLLPIIGLSLFVGAIVYGFDQLFGTFLNYDIFRLISGSLLGVTLFGTCALLFKMSSFVELKNILLRR